MKRLFSLLTALMLLLSLAACGGNTDDGKDSGGGSGNDLLDEFRDDGGKDDDGKNDDGGSDSDPEGFHDGRIGETLETYFFDFSVEDAFLCPSYGDYTPAEGYSLLVVSMTIKNTDTASLPMWDSDFVVQWDGGDDAFAYPVPDADGLISDDQFPSEYELGINQSRSGVLFFEVPADQKDFALGYLELFDDGTEEGEEGDMFVVYFTAENKTSL